MTNVEDPLSDVLFELGDFGKYQCLVVTLLSVNVMLHAFPHNAFVFTARNVDYRCKISECYDDPNVYKPTWLEYAVPFKGKKPKTCEKYQFLEDTNNASCCDNSFNNEQIENCEEFVYKTEEKSILHDYNLQCDQNLWKLTLVGTINIIGQFVGLPISGVFSDNYGRRTVLVVGSLLCALFGGIKAFSPNYVAFCILEFLDSVSLSGTYVSSFLLGVELVGPKKRVLAGTIIWCFYPIGVVIMAGIAWAIDSWRLLTLIFYIPQFLIFFYFWIVPESVRWLLTKGKYKDAQKVLIQAANMNGKELSEKALQKMTTSTAEEDKEPFSHVFKSKILRMRFLNACFCWITCVFLFYGFTLNSVTLAGNNYVDFMLTSIVEIPAYVVVYYVVNKFGRRMCQMASFMVTTIACIGFIFIDSSLHSVQLFFYLLGKSAATAAFTICYIISSEIFPTSLRHSLMGACSMFGRIGAMVAPQMPLLANIWAPFPLALFAVMSFIAGVLTLFFPETLNIKLPDTIEEAESIGRNDKEKNGKNACI